MATKQLSRRQKAITIVPLALLCGAWTLSLAGLGSADAASTADHHGKLPDGTSVPSQAIEAPASVPQAGEIAPGVPNGTAQQVVDGASTSGIPSAALSAYQRAAQIINAADKTCHVPWELIAAIGRVESDHGRYGGNTLTAQGVSTPGIFGPELNGKNGTQAIQDTDGGVLDHDTVYDRAVGPMQFIPSTWQVVKVDANGDGKRNPQDINDASLATAVYLCSGPDNLGTRKGQEAGVYRYNHSSSYVDLVLRIMEAYKSGDYTAVPTGASGGSVFAPRSATALQQARAGANGRPRKHHSGGGSGSGGSSGGGTTGGGANLPTSGGGGSGGGSTLPPAPIPTPSAPSVPQVLSHAEALTVCSSQLGSIPDPLNLLGSTANSICANKVTGMTKSAAISAIPNSLCAALRWLNLSIPLGTC